jgi:ABC-type phosphate transport system auxiliary subunit
MHDQIIIKPVVKHQVQLLTKNFNKMFLTIKQLEAAGGELDEEALANLALIENKLGKMLNQLKRT